MCAREGCSHNRKWHNQNTRCAVEQCDCPNYIQNEIYTNWGIYKDVSKNHDFKDVNSFFPHCHPLRLDEFLEFEPISEDDREKFDRKIGIDEPYAWGLDSRKSQSYYGIESSSQIFQHRKTVGGILVCTQLPSRVDKGIRETQDDFFFAVKPNDWGFHYVWFGAVTYMMHLDRSYVQETVWPHYNHKEKIKPYFLEDFNEEDLKSGWKEDQEMVDKAISTTFNHMIVDMKGVRNVRTD